MSYDLMVFDPLDAPRDRKHFIEWYHRTTKWSEGHSYDDPKATSVNLQAWFDDMSRAWPPMNGPLASHDYDDLHVTDYTIGHHFIYAAFAWSLAEEAYSVVRQLAVRYEVGFYDVSGDEGEGEIHFPGDQLKPPSDGAWRDVARDFEELEKR